MSWPRALAHHNVQNAKSAFRIDARHLPDVRNKLPILPGKELARSTDLELAQSFMARGVDGNPCPQPRHQDRPWPSNEKSIRRLFGIDAPLEPGVEIAEPVVFASNGPAGS